MKLRLALLAVSILALSTSLAFADGQGLHPLDLDHGDVPLIAPDPVIAPDPGTPPDPGPIAKIPELPIAPLITPGGDSGFDGNGLALDLHTDRGYVRLGCELDDDTAEINDMLLTNRGDKTLHAGATVRYAFLPNGASGYLRLNVDLPAGGKARAIDLFFGTADSACVATLL